MNEWMNEWTTLNLIKFFGGNEHDEQQYMNQGIQSTLLLLGHVYDVALWYKFNDVMNYTFRKSIYFAKLSRPSHQFNLLHVKQKN
jgi:hypothetical protein